MKSISNKIKSIILILAVVVLATTLNVEIVKADSNKVDIMFTSDLHSNISNYDEIVDGRQINVGGFARLKTLIDKKMKENPETLLLDCGDIVMGALSQDLMDQEAVELDFMVRAGYDALTYGNHEFDYGAKALSDMYEIVADRYDERTAFVICNVDWNQTDEYTTTLKKGMEKYGYSDYIMVEKDGVRIAITGVIGYDAIKCAPTCELTFLDPIEAVKDTVKKIKETENPDMIVCISHSGTGAELGSTEDEVLAKKVPDLDVIVSGHTHTVLDEGITVGNTHILSCGAYGLYTGDMSFEKNSDGRWNITKYKLVLMDDSIEEDAETLNYVKGIDEIIDERILAPYGMKTDDIIAYNNGIVFETVDYLYNNHEEIRVGNLMSDAYRYIANSTPTGRERPFDIAVVPSGTVREIPMKGNIYTDDAFAGLSLGIGPDGKVGYPLVSIYLTGKEIKTVVEVDASISDLMNSARLFTSGVSCEFNPKRMILNKTVDVWLSPAFLEDSYEKIENDKMYRIVTDSYSMSMLGAVTDMSKGILSVVPKDENGKPIENTFDTIIYDENGNELKAWVAYAEYLKSFSRNDSGISVIPEYYATTHNRKVVNDSLSPRAMFKNTSKYFYIVVAICLLIILLIIVIIRSIVKRKHKKKVFK